ncbi:MAG: divalent-cation tolerance protein CutA [Pyrobaculum sp.]
MYIVVFITTPDLDAAKKISRHLLERRVASCINMAPVKSMYWWEGKIEEAEEVLLIIKTTIDKLNELVKEVKSIHPYQLPEIVALPIVGGLRDYLSWVDRETHG